MSSNSLKSPLIVVESGASLDDTAARSTCRGRRVRYGAAGLLTLIMVVGFAAVALTHQPVLTPDHAIVSSEISLMKGPTADFYRQEAQSVVERQVAADMISASLQPNKSLRVEATASGSIEVKPEEIIHWAEKTWDFILAGKPVVNLDRHYATVVPKGISRMEDMSNWSSPTVQGPYALNGKNRFDQVVASVEYSLVYQHSGRYNGKGRYLNHVGIVVHHTDVVWSNSLQATVVTDEPTNCGSAEEPIAGISIDIQFAVDTWTKHDILEHSFFVRGDGGFEAIHADQPIPKEQFDDDNSEQDIIVNIE